MRQHFRAALLAATLTAPTAAGGAWLATRPAATTVAVPAWPGVVCITDFGADPASPDNTAAIQTALDAGANDVYVPPGAYTCLGPLHIDRGLRLHGPSGSQWLCPSIIQWGLHSTDSGVVVRSVSETGDPGSRGDWSTIEGLTLQQVYYSSVDHPCHGITLHAPCTVKDCYVRYFTGDGIHIEASVGATPSASASLWKVDNVQCSDNLGNGLYVSGTDTNAGTALMLDCITNGGWGVRDQSFLGNTYLGGHMRGNKLGPYTVPNSQAVNYSTFVGLYVESDTHPASITPGTVVVGGNAQNAGITGGQCWLPGVGRMTLTAADNTNPPLRFTAWTSGTQTIPHLQVCDRGSNEQLGIYPDGSIRTRYTGNAASHQFNHNGNVPHVVFGVNDQAGSGYLGATADVVSAGTGPNYGQGVWKLRSRANAGMADVLTLLNGRGTVGGAGLGLPALTTAQRNALRGPDAGSAVVIWNRDTGKVEGNDGAGWK